MDSAFSEMSQSGNRRLLCGFLSCRGRSTRLGWQHSKYRGRRSSSRRCLFRKAKRNECIFGSVILGRTLGSGASGSVYLADLKGHPVAVKIVSSCVSEDAWIPEEFISKIRHPNILRVMAVKQNLRLQCISQRRSSDVSLCWDSVSSGSFSGSFSELAMGIPSKDENGICPTKETWIMMEYCDLGELRVAIRGKNFHLDGDLEQPNMTKILCAASHVANAMACLHRIGIVHGDLKSENIFLKSSSNAPFGFVAKVGDFGTSRMLETHRVLQTERVRGTVDHMAPEVLVNGEVRTAADVFAFGMILLEFVTARSPFQCRTSASILMAIVEGIRPEIPANVPEPYADLIRDCWDPDWWKRPEFTDIHRRITAMMRQLKRHDKHCEDRRQLIPMCHPTACADVGLEVVPKGSTLVKA